MKFRRTIDIILLLACMQLISAYKFRCWMFCTDQTAIQNDYIDHRDNCRRYAQLRIETDTSNPEAMDEKARTQKLISLFSSCMAEKGWTVPDGSKGNQAAAPVPVQNVPTVVPAPAATAAPAVAPGGLTPAIVPNNNDALIEQRRQRAALSRTSECAFARHGAAYSSVSAARAQACDIECREKRDADPQGPRPAACPGETE